MSWEQWVKETVRAVEGGRGIEGHRRMVSKRDIFKAEWGKRECVEILLQAGIEAELVQTRTDAEPKKDYERWD